MKTKKTIEQKISPVLVIGDLIIDAHHFMNYGGISQETKGPLGLYNETKVAWGGAGLVVKNILALGGTATFISPLGEDGYAKEADLFNHKNLRKVFFNEP